MVKFEPNNVSTTELADIMGVSRQFIFTSIKKGKIRAIKMGKNYKIPIAEVKRIQKEGI